LKVVVSGGSDTPQKFISGVTYHREIYSELSGLADIYFFEGSDTCGNMFSGG
jgi:hypothetical protein